MNNLSITLYSNRLKRNVILDGYTSREDGATIVTATSLKREYELFRSEYDLNDSMEVLRLIERNGAIVGACVRLTLTGAHGYHSDFIGEAYESTLKSEISNSYPVTMAANRAKANAILAFLQFNESVYTDEQMERHDDVEKTVITRNIVPAKKSASHDVVAASAAKEFATEKRAKHEQVLIGDLLQAMRQSEAKENIPETKPTNEVAPVIEAEPAIEDETVIEEDVVEETTCDALEEKPLTSRPNVAFIEADGDNIVFTFATEEEVAENNVAEEKCDEVAENVEENVTENVTENATEDVAENTCETSPEEVEEGFGSLTDIIDEEARRQEVQEEAPASEAETSELDTVLGFGRFKTVTLREFLSLIEKRDACALRAKELIVRGGVTKGCGVSANVLTLIKKHCA